MREQVKEVVFFRSRGDSEAPLTASEKKTLKRAGHKKRRNELKAIYDSARA